MSELTCIRGAALLTLDRANRIVDPGELWFDGSGIVYAGALGGFSPPEGVAVVEIDGTDNVAMPGFVNGHTHSYTALLKGTVDTIPLDVFMIQVIVAAGARSPRDVYVSALLGCLEMLQTGTTGCLDHFSHRPKHDPEALDAACQAYADAGLRVALSPMFSDLPFIETIPLDAADMPADLRSKLPGVRQDHGPYFEMMADALARWKDHALVRLMLGVDSPQRCSDQLLRRAGAFCADHGIGNHTHLLEAKTQWAMAEPRDSRGFVAYLANCGLVGPLSSFAHFIWFTDHDLDTAAASGVNVVHNPGSNLILGSGIQPLLRLIDAGVPVAFGSDGLNAGHMSMFEKTRLAAFLTRMTDSDPDRWLPAGPALRMATVNGARVLGAPGERGELAAGQAADIVLLDGKSLALSPRGALDTQVLFYELGSSVTDVFVGGERVLADRKPTRFDGAAVIEEATEIAARLARENQAALQAAQAFHPGLKTMVKRIQDNGCGPCRLAGLV